MHEKPLLSEMKIPMRTRTFNKPLKCQQLIPYSAKSKNVNFPSNFTHSAEILNTKISDYKVINQKEDFIWY